MRNFLVAVCLAFITSFATAQQPPQSPSSANTAATKDSATTDSTKNTNDSFAQPDDSALKNVFEAKIKTEWDALKSKDKKSYGDMLDDEYQGVELDGEGERNKLQAINELTVTNVFDYTLFGLKVTPLGPDAAFVVYEVTMQFPPRAQIRYSRIYVGALWVKRGGQWKELHYQETHVK
jgi:Domain of unknown function (DUF4440)